MSETKITSNNSFRYRGRKSDFKNLPRMRKVGLYAHRIEKNVFILCLTRFNFIYFCISSLTFQIGLA